MSTHTINGFITYEKREWESKASVNFYNFKPSVEHFPDLVVVGEHSFEVEVPDDFNPTPLQVAALQAQKKALRLKLADELRAIDERISKLTCITNEVTA